MRHAERDRIVAELKQRNIFLNVHHPFPIHCMRGYADLGYRDGDFPVAERLAREVFSLPVYPTLQAEEQEAVCVALEDILD